MMSNPTTTMMMIISLYNTIECYYMWDHLQSIVTSCRIIGWLMLSAFVYLTRHFCEACFAEKVYRTDRIIIWAENRVAWLVYCLGMWAKCKRNVMMIHASFVLSWAIIKILRLLTISRVRFLAVFSHKQYSTRFEIITSSMCHAQCSCYVCIHEAVRRWGSFFSLVEVSVFLKNIRAKCSILVGVWLRAVTSL